MQIPALLARELRRLLANHHYEVAPSGIYFPTAHLMAGGAMDYSIDDGPLNVCPNTFTTEGATHILNVAFHDDPKVATWYFSLWTANATPAITWTAVNFQANATEFLNYNEAARPAYVEAVAVAGSITNTASKATFTMSTGGGSIWGGALHSVAAKSAATGTLAAAAKFAALQTLTATSQINLGYTLNLTPA